MAKIIVNGIEKSVEAQVLTYEDALWLAGKENGATVTFYDRVGKEHGALAPGERVVLREIGSLVLNVVHTGNA